MALEADIAHGGQGFVVRSAEDRARAFVAAARHTRLVHFLRKALPVFAVLVLFSYFVTSQLGVSISVGDLTASIDGIQVSDGNLRMTNPKFEGTDNKNGKYVIGADFADQDIKDPKIIKLHAIRAELATADGGWSRMNAVRGVFDSRIERLVMQEKITVATSSGITGELKHASLEAKTQTLRSHRPVFFTLPNGTIEARALTFRSSDSTLVFRGKVHLHMIRKEAPPKEATRTDPAAPLAVPPLPAAPRIEDTGVIPVSP